MGLHGAFAQEQLGADLAVGQSSSDRPQGVEFPRRQAVQRLAESGDARWWPLADFRACDRLDAGGYLGQFRRQSAVARVPGGAMVIGHDDVQRLLSDRSLRSPVQTFGEMHGFSGGLVHRPDR